MQVASPHQMMVPLSLLVMTHRLSPDALLGTTFGFSKDTWVLGGGGPFGSQPFVLEVDTCHSSA